MKKRGRSMRRKRGRNGRVEGNRKWGWSEVADVLVKTVEEVCGLGNRGVASPWTVGREREIEERIEGITERVRRRNGEGGAVEREEETES